MAGMVWGSISSKTAQPEGRAVRESTVRFRLCVCELPT